VSKLSLSDRPRFEKIDTLGELISLKDTPHRPHHIGRARSAIQQAKAYTLSTASRDTLESPRERRRAIEERLRIAL